MLEHIQGVAANQPNILDALAVDRRQQLGQALAIDLHREHIEIGLLQRHRSSRRPSATTDFKYQGAVRPNQVAGSSGGQLPSASRARRPYVGQDRSHAFCCPSDNDEPRDLKLETRRGWWFWLSVRRGGGADGSRELVGG